MNHAHTCVEQVTYVCWGFNIRALDKSRTCVRNVSKFLPVLAFLLVVHNA